MKEGLQEVLSSWQTTALDIIPESGRRKLLSDSLSLTYVSKEIKIVINLNSTSVCLCVCVCAHNAQTYI